MTAQGPTPPCPSCGTTNPDTRNGLEATYPEGVLVWECLACHHAWGGDFPDNPDLTQRAALVAAIMNRVSGA